MKTVSFLFMLALVSSLPASAADFAVDTYITERMQDKTIPEPAKQLVSKGFASYYENLFPLLDSLQKGKAVNRLFYFLALSNTFQSAELAFSRTLQQTAQNFIETYPVEFFTYATYKPAITEAMITLWAEAACSEISLNGELYETDELSPFLEKVKAKMDGADAAVQQNHDWLKKYMNEHDCY